jgi:3-dehydroquinate synthase
VPSFDLSVTPLPLSTRYYCSCGILGPGPKEETLADLLIKAQLASPFFVVSNPRVGELYGEAVRNSLDSRGLPYFYVEVPDGERYKSLYWARRLIEHMIHAGLHRGSTVIALGGGVISDLAGLAAATYMRGIPHACIATTLLAQVDASIGGKVAVDHRQAKNIMGTFHHPRLIISDPEVTRTLEPRQWSSGFAEIIKSAAIASTSLFETLEEHSLHYYQENYASLEEIVFKVARIKSSIVMEDPFEKGVRAHLNFGHTLGHALESATSYRRFLHGEAVAIGMRGAIMIAWELGFGNAAMASRMDRLLSSYCLPLSIRRVDDEKVMAALRLDKKRGLHQARFVLLRDLGEPFVTDEVPESLIRQVLKRLR